jgi:alpha-D-xyloside xylohydrolase
MANRGTFMRALAFDFRSDPKALAQTDEYMFGKALLVAPVVEQGATSRNVYLPGKAPWFDFWTGQRLAAGQSVQAPAPLDRIPVYARAGSIIPLGPVKAYADARPDGPIEVRVYPGADGRFALYDDSGDGFGYKRGEYGLVHFAWNDRSRTLLIGPREGHYASNPKFRIVCGSSANDAREVSYAGQAMRVKLLRCR